MSAPPASFPDTRQNWANHADDSYESYHWEEPSKDDIRNNNPIERNSWSLKMSVETFLCHNCILPYLISFSMMVSIEKQNGRKYIFAVLLVVISMLRAGRTLLSILEPVHHLSVRNTRRSNASCSNAKQV